MSIRKDMTICMVYVMKASMSPTIRLPRSMPFAPNQTIRMLMPFMISIIMGIMIFITRLVNSWVRIRSRFALSNRSSSNRSLLKARITDTPVRISRDTRFRRSTRACIFLNLGMATAISTPTKARMRATATAMIHPMPVLVPSTFTMPPMPMMGAYTTIRSIITTTICTCWMSLVLRVIREAVENCSISAWEKDTTLENTRCRRFRPSLAPMRDARKPTRMAVAIITTE